MSTRSLTYRNSGASRLKQLNQHPLLCHDQFLVHCICSLRQITAGRLPNLLSNRGQFQKARWNVQSQYTRLAITRDQHLFSMLYGCRQRLLSAKLLSGKWENSFGGASVDAAAAARRTAQHAEINHVAPPPTTTPSGTAFPLPFLPSPPRRNNFAAPSGSVRRSCRRRWRISTQSVWRRRLVRFIDSCA